MRSCDKSNVVSQGSFPLDQIKQKKFSDCRQSQAIATKMATIVSHLLNSDGVSCSHRI